MKDKYTLITGASSGIGYELAKLYANKGENLILVARRLDKLEEFKNKFPNIKILNIKMDLSLIDSSNKIYDITKKENIFVNRLINNAGVGLFGDFSDTDLNREINMINLNIISLVSLTKMYLKDMLKENEGEILNVSSIASFMPGPRMSIYYATKAFVTSFTEALRYEIKNSNIKVSILAPGATSTEFIKSSNLENSKLFDNMRVQTPEEVAKISFENMGKRLIIPGILNKLTVFLVKFVPKNILLKVVDEIQKRKDKK